MGELLGKQYQARDFAAACYPTWTGNELVKAVATAFSESDLFVGAYNDNPNNTRDCGIFEINIPESEVGTDVEAQYRTESLDLTDYEPVVKNSVKAAKALYEQPWHRNGKADIRRWEAWFGYTEGWATFPHAWIWHVPQDGTAPFWQATGRYLHKAIAGIANFHYVIKKDKTLDEAVSFADLLGHNFGLDSRFVISTKYQVVTFKPPVKPTVPPKDGVGPRPLPNTGF